MLRKPAFAGLSAALIVFCMAGLFVPLGAGNAQAFGNGEIRERIRERIKERREERRERFGTDESQDQSGAGRLESRTIAVGGVSRSYLLYIPRSLKRSGSAPAVFALHGSKGTAEKLVDYLALNPVADREGFIVVYPQGIDKAWNDGRPAEARNRKDAKPGDDISFLNALFDALTGEGMIDQKRVYMTGLSNGGFMSVTMACEAPGRFAAIAPVIASAPNRYETDCKPGGPFPVLMINGTKDRLIPFEGTTEGGGTFAIPALGEFWAKLNGCREVRERKLPDVDRSDRSTVVFKSWVGCQRGGSVEQYIVVGGGHQPPAASGSSGGRLSNALLGPRNGDIDTAETVWAFFKRFQR
jgi:polyhydroxybutyrate depolymerase